MVIRMVVNSKTLGCEKGLPLQIIPTIFVLDGQQKALLKKLWPTQKVALAYPSYHQTSLILAL